MLSILTQHGYVQMCVGSCDFTNPQGVPKESLGQARLADLKKKWLCHKNSQIALKKAKNTRFEKRSSAAHFKKFFLGSLSSSDREESVKGKNFVRRGLEAMLRHKA